MAHLGTSLRKEVFGARELVKGLCSGVHRNGGKTFWINPKLPPKNVASLFSQQILLKSDDLFSNVFAAWKPQLKALQARKETLEIANNRTSRARKRVDYAGMATTRKSRSEKEETNRVNLRRINKLL